MNNEVKISESFCYCHQDTVSIGIARIVPMRIDLFLPRGADWRTPFDALASRFRIYQYRKDENGRDVVRWRSQDLHLWHDNDCHYFQLTFNKERSLKERESDRDRLCAAICEAFTKCKAVIQYRDEIDEEAVHEMAERKFRELQGKLVICPDRNSYIQGFDFAGKLLRHDGCGTPFAIKKPRARKYVYPRTEIDVCFAREAV